MKLKVDKQDKGQAEIELKISIPFSEQKNILNSAATRLATAKPIKGFRPGKASFEVIEKNFGGNAILTEALEELVGKSYYQVLQEQKLEVIGQPKIEITKQAYGDDLEFTATIALLPFVKVGDFSNFSVKKQEVKVGEKEIEKALDDLRNVRAQEIAVDREARSKDLVELDFSTSIDNIPIEGGEAKKYPLVLGDKQMIPGFEEKIESMKVNDEKIFKLKFPKDYKQDLAGKEAEFKVKLLAVRERKLPELDDSLAQALGQKNLAGLKKLIEENLSGEAEQKENQRQEIEILHGLVEKSEFGTIPKLLIENEIHRMNHELEDELKTRGIEYSDYLKNLGKTKEEFEKELEPKAIQRVKTALLTRFLSQQENIKADEEEIDKELEMTKKQYQNNLEVLKNLDLPEYREYISNILTNRKVIEWLRKKIIK